MSATSPATPLAAALLLALSATAFAQGTSIGTTQGSPRAAGDARGSVTSPSAGATAPPPSVHGNGPGVLERQGASSGASAAPNPACVQLASIEREKCLREAGREQGGTASGLGGSPDRVGPGSSGMGR